MKQLSLQEELQANAYREEVSSSEKHRTEPGR